MDLIWLWPAVALGLLGLIAVLLAAWLPSHRREGLPVAHRWRLTALPGYRRALRRRMLVLAAALGVVGLGGASALLGAARPVAVEISPTTQERRDVLLCLDASGSMIEANVDIIDAYLEMIDHFDGARIGMMMFNSTSVMAFPLTDDYDMAAGLLADARLGFASYGYSGTNFFIGTTAGPGASLVGDGLASCVDGFDRTGEQRARSIVFATDNDVAGEQLFTVEQAAQLAVEEDIHIYVMGVRSPGLLNATVSMDDLRDAAAVTDGEYFDLEPGTGERVADLIHQQDSARTPDEPVVRVSDRPQAALSILALAVPMAFVLLWRLRL